MGSISDHLENELLDHVCQVGAYTPAATVYVALSTADPTDDATGLSEPVGNGYAREAITFAAAASRKVVQSGDITFTTATGAWGTITHYAIMDALTAGNMLAHGAFATSKAIVSGNTPKIASGEIQVEFSTGAASSYLAHALLDRAFRNQAYSQPDLHVALSTTVPTDTGNVTEPVGNGYARKDHDVWAAAAAGATSNTGAITFSDATGDWGEITYVVLYDALTAGNYLARGDVTNQTVGNGDTVEFPDGDLDITLA